MYILLLRFIHVFAGEADEGGQFHPTHVEALLAHVPFVHVLLHFLPVVGWGMM